MSTVKDGVQINREDELQLRGMYNQVFALVEEELFQRLNPDGYVDPILDNRKSTNGTSNADIASLEKDFLSRYDTIIMKGGSADSSTSSSVRTSNYVPGKMDAVRYSFNVPLHVALRGTAERQRLYAKRKQQATKNK